MWFPEEQFGVFEGDMSHSAPFHPTRVGCVFSVSFHILVSERYRVGGVRIRTIFIIVFNYFYQ